jgi:uncharacterized heparinase superfamily protein
MYATRPPWRTTRFSRSSRQLLVAGPLDPLRAARDRIGLALLAADGLRRSALARMRRSHLVRWRHRAPIAHELLLAPPDLRTVDPTFVDEVGYGSLGLAGLTAELSDGSPFVVPPPSPAWARELHGFGWLRHFAAVRTLDNEALARRLVEQWLAIPRRAAPMAWVPDVVGRRMLSWLSHAGVLLDGADRRAHAILLRSLEDQAGHLSAAWRDAPDGYPKLLALIALVQSCLCIGGHERRLEAAEKQLIAELGRQVLDDGGHISRNPGTLVALLLDLLPLRQCFNARGLTPADALAGAIDRMMAMLRRLRLGDGQLARFNGMGATERDALAMVLAYQRGGTAGTALPAVSGSGYVRLERGATVIIVDAGPPPPVALAGQACAGSLSFELSVGEELLLVNGGAPTAGHAPTPGVAPAAAHARATGAARGTASHNTLVLGGQSSSTLIRNAGLRRRLGAAPIRHPDRVTCEVAEHDDGAVVLRASHDGYAGRFGLVHARTLMLSPDGACLDGEDTLAGLKGEVRLAEDIPVAVHFHLPPQAGARYGAAQGMADITLRNGTCWRLSAAGATLTIEPDTHFAGVRGPVHAQQVVLRTVCYGAAGVRWRLERL